MNIDFVKVPFLNNPSMQKYEGPIVKKHPSDFYLEEKKRSLEDFDKDLYGESELFKESQILSKVKKLLDIETPGSFLDISMQFEEDLAIMHRGKLEAIAFCFPSGWIPRNGLGQGFQYLHNPVADNELLLKSSNKLTEYMTKHRIQRWVWNVTTINELSNHPKVERPDITSFEDLYFRLETQISTPVDEETSLFSVHVSVVPLHTIWDNKILESINSMSHNILKYKNLVEIKNYLNTIKI